jgi:integrase
MAIKHSSTTHKRQTSIRPEHLQQRSILAHERNGIIVGLLVYQALASGELEKLSVEDINLTAGTIYIAGNARSNSRTLPLNTQQVLPLYSYIHGGTREKLQALPVLGLPSNHREGEHFKNSLLIGKMYGVVKQVVQELRGINPQIKNAQHIRASVILHWLKQHNKRQVQYMAGHRYIDSTEKYALQQMDTLTDALTKYHPFG